jgi:hypothetical protein
MKMPKMSARRWFWSVVAAGMVWSLVGWRWDGGRARVVAPVQHGLSQIPVTMLIPPGFLLSTAQAMAQGALGRDGSRGQEPPEELRARIRSLENENAQLKRMLADANDRLQAMHQLQLLRIRPEEVLAASIVGRGTGAASNLLRLDKGATSGVRAGDAVVAPLEQVCVLGRVARADQLDCLVQLFSDAQMNTSVQIVRPMLQMTPGGPGPYENIAITPKETPCNLAGLGGGQMQIDDVNVRPPEPNVRLPEPQKGDLILLTDAAWPAQTQHMVIGQIDSVGRKATNPLRYDIRVSSRVVLPAQRTVMILTNRQ